MVASLSCHCQRDGALDINLTAQGMIKFYIINNNNNLSLINDNITATCKIPAHYSRQLLFAATFCVAYQSYHCNICHLDCQIVHMYTITARCAKFYQAAYLLHDLSLCDLMARCMHTMTH